MPLAVTLGALLVARRGNTLGKYAISWWLYEDRRRVCPLLHQFSTLLAWAWTHRRGITTKRAAGTLQSIAVTNRSVIATRPAHGCPLPYVRASQSMPGHFTEESHALSALHSMLRVWASCSRWMHSTWRPARPSPCVHLTKNGSCTNCRLDMIECLETSSGIRDNHVAHRHRLSQPCSEATWPEHAAHPSPRLVDEPFETPRARLLGINTLR